jgi:uncharacterized protein (TIGR02271 family)
MADNQHIKPDKDITGGPDAGKVGAGVGAVGGGVAGAAMGSAVAGPVGTILGAIAGAVAGAFGGKAIGEAVDPEAEDRHWREKHSSEPYVAKNRTYEEYRTAYRTGFEGPQKYEPGTRFEEAEPQLKEDYHATGATLPWEHARPASEAAWRRVERGEAVTIGLSEEQVKVGKREVEGGGVRLRKVVRTEMVNQPVRLRHEEVEVTREAVREGATVPTDAFTEGEVYIPLKREEAVVEKTARQIGEVRATKRQAEETRNVDTQIRREDVQVEREDPTRK